ncbi:hypothetical protein L916_09027 [Phytophthora nicotianae]|uniref:Uncharacterized protein n=2 Tax=Phytophthora nicotianae TaxID=4792 RepID=V9F448_PHYNI|nr:hypothetical protein F443_09296 [Phytophthora nicotianae P1569]ETL39666.1 hypothetical protein L916_09027 [Phytophthora nicotianae]
MDLTLSACSYTAENLYVVNSTEPQMMFPSGYVECTKATGTDTALCEICSCREKKIASVAGVTVAWVVCVGSGDATACTNNATSVQEFCASTNDSSGSSSCDGFSTNVGDSSSCNISEVITNGSGASADVSLTPTTTAPNTSVDTSVDEGSAESSSSLAAIDTSGSMDTSADVGSSDAVSEETSSISSKTGSGSRIDGSSSSSYNISSSVGSNSAPNLSSASSDIEVKIPTPSSEISRSQATSEDNVVPADVGTVEPAQTNTATSTEQNIIRPSDNESSNEFDTNNGASPTSDWSGTRLTAMITILCGIAAVAGIAVFVAVRRDQDRKNKELETPIDDSDSSLATPTTSSLDERYCKGRRGRTGLVDTSDNTVLASIVVIGANDDLLAPVDYSSGRQYRSFSGKMSGSYARTESVKASDGEMRLDNSYLNVAPASQLQFNISHGPSSSDLPLPTHDPIFDTSNTKVSFSSSMNSDSAHPPSERMYESEDISSDSFRRISATYSVGSGRDSVPSLEPENSPDQEANLVVSNTTRSFASSLSSIEFALRDTEASEHIHPSELGTTSSRIALSFESNFGVGSGSLSGGHRHHEN